VLGGWVSEPDPRGLDARHDNPAAPWKALAEYRIEEDAAMGYPEVRSLNGWRSQTALSRA
jgi:hypothetical protein